LIVNDLATDSTILFDYTWLLYQESPETRRNNHQKARSYFWLNAVTHTHDPSSRQYLLLNTKKHSQWSTTQERYITKPAFHLLSTTFS